MGSNNITIRQAEVDEWSKVPALHRDEGEKYMEGSRQRNKMRFSKIPQGTHIVLFAERQGRVVGAIQIELVHTNTKLADGKTIAHLNDLVVDPDVRGQGIGTRLMNLAEEMLQEKGFAKVTLGVWRNKKHAGLCAFYDKRGYQVWYEKKDGTATVLKKDLEQD